MFISNLAPSASEESVTDLFSEYGKVRSIKLAADVFSGKCRGFGFVEMPGKAEAQKALTELNTFEFKGKKIIVNEARPQKERGGGGRRR